MRHVKKSALILATLFLLSGCRTYSAKSRSNENQCSDTLLANLVGTWYSVSPSDPNYYKISPEEVSDWKNWFLKDSLFDFCVINSSGFITNQMYWGQDLKEATSSFNQNISPTYQVQQLKGWILCVDEKILFRQSMTVQALLFNTKRIQHEVVRLSADSFDIRMLKKNGKKDDYVLRYYRLQ